MKDFIQQYTRNVPFGQLILFIAYGALVALLLFTIPVKFTLLMLAGIVVFAVIAKWPEAGLLIIVVLTSSIVYEENLPLIPIGIGSLHIPDILLLFMFSLVIIKKLSSNNNIALKSPPEKALALFLLLTILIVIASVKFFGIDFHTVLRLFRSISYYLIFYIITNLIVTKKQIRFLVTGLFITAAVVAVVMLIQTTVGESIPLIPESRIDYEGNALRLRPPGQTLLFVSLVQAICFSVILADKPLLLSRYFYFVIIICTGVMLTFTRSYLVAFIFIIGFFFFLAKPYYKKRLVTLTVWCATLSLLLFMVLGGGSKVEDTFNAISQRYLTLFTGKELLQSSTISDRNLENFYAFEQIKKNPIFGNGLGNDYRPTLYGSEDELMHYVHNVYLWLIKDFGILGFAFFMWFYISFLIRALKNFNKPEDDFLKSVATGSMLAGIGMLPMAFVIPLFMEWHSIVVIATFIGLSETIIINTKHQVHN